MRVSVINCIVIWKVDYGNFLPEIPELTTLKCDRQLFLNNYVKTEMIQMKLQGVVRSGEMRLETFVIFGPELAKWRTKPFWGNFFARDTMPNFFWLRSSKLAWNMNTECEVN